MKETPLKIRVWSRHLFDKIRCGIFNATNGKIKVSSIIVGGEDTEMLYELSAESAKKLTQAQLLWCQTLSHGISIGCELESKFERI